jgi:type I restriction-modification system DNA methylase subunit
VVIEFPFKLSATLKFGLVFLALNGPYLPHIARSLRSTGNGAYILAHGVLFRGNAEADIRCFAILNVAI